MAPGEHFPCLCGVEVQSIRLTRRLRCIKVPVWFRGQSFEDGSRNRRDADLIGVRNARPQSSSQNDAIIRNARAFWTCLFANMSILTRLLADFMALSQ